MRLTRLFVPLSLLLLGVGCAMQSPTPPATSFGLAGLDTPRHHRQQRASSADPHWNHGNGDARPIPPGETLTLAELQGPGRITHIWFTIAAQDRQYGRKTTLRIYWDGETEPSVEAPLGDFFAVGHGLRRDLDSLPVAVSSEGRAYNCYWPMPFHRSARITMSNDSDKPVAALFWYVDWQQLDSLPPDTPYFHARYRQEHPTQPGRNYLILDTEGKGHYVGTVLNWRAVEDGWPGEGDDFFFIDGEEAPSLRGTGTEDYFCDAWGFRELNRPYYGISVWEGYVTGARCTAYRWHITDPVPFEKSLRLEIENWGSRSDDEGRLVSGFVDRQDHYSSVAFWYQTGKEKDFDQYPADGADRLLPSTMIEIEESLEALNKDSDRAVLQEGPYSGGAQIYWPVLEPEWEVSIPFRVERSGKYFIQAQLTRSFDYGIFDIYLDDQLMQRNIDLYNPQVDTREFYLGHAELQAGPHSLRFVNRGANDLSRLYRSEETGYFLGVDALRLTEF